jgi:hypothetical protein
VPSVSFEMVAMQDWPPGEFTNAHKRTSDVLHRGYKIVQEGHNCGPLITDITLLVPANYYYAIMWPFSSRKIAFSASTVQADRAPVGCAAALLPMMTCGDPISAPTAFVASSHSNTVEVGMNGTDFATGLAFIALSMVIDGVINKLGGKSIVAQARAAFRQSEALVAHAALPAVERAVMSVAERSQLGQTLVDRAVGKIFGFNDPRSLARRALVIAADSAAARQRARNAGAANADDWTATVTVGVPGASIARSYTISDDPRRTGLGRQVSLLDTRTSVSANGTVSRVRNSSAVATPRAGSGHP